jgi:hypothetical protein
MSTNKPIILEVDGIFGQLPNGAIINAGGTSNSTWTVDGKGLLFDDGTSTAPGGGGSPFTLQIAYNNSPVVSGQTGIKLATGKDFVILDDTDNSLYFKVDAETGKVTITGDLEVLGSSTIIDTVVQDSDHWLISPKSGTTTALKIEPDIGVTPIVDLVTIRKTFGSTPVFRIDVNGNVIATQNITLGGLLNGVNVVQVRDNLAHHLAGDPGYRHTASVIDISPITTLPGATNVQEALEQINIKADLGGGGTTRGYEHVQATAASLWTITHNLISMRCQVVVYDDSYEQLIPEKVQLIDANTLIVSFTTAISGRAMVIAF